MTAPGPLPTAPLRRMTARDPKEGHRVATPLELLFDLCFVVAVAQASGHLHHALAQGHVGLGVIVTYCRVFFAIWWAWMNFTWFASAYDVDDVPYRLAVLVQIAGILVLAAGVPRGFDTRDFSIMTLGYAVMRLGLVSLWLRAARSNPSQRRTALRFAVGVTLAEVGWLSLLLLPPEQAGYGWLVLAPIELLVPVWAERAGRTPWHAHHISERYGLLTLIVLGESVAAATNAIQSAADGQRFTASFLGLICGSLLILFSMWWLYFDSPAHTYLRSNRQGFIWGYGHILIFASTAAVGAALAVSSDFLSGRTHLRPEAAGGAVAISVILYLLGVWVFQVRPLKRGRVLDAAFFLAAALIYAVCGFHSSVLVIGLILSVLVTVSVRAPPASTG